MDKKRYHMYYTQHNEVVHVVVATDSERKDLLFWWDRSPNIKFIGCLVEWTRR